MTRPGLTTILVLLLIGSNAFWIYGVVDQGVTQMYTETDREYIQFNYDQLLALANKNLIGVSAKDAMNKIDKDIHGLDPYIKDGCLYYGQVCLRLDSNNYIEGYGEKAP